MPTADVLVIGGGLLGSSVAYELARSGARVVLADDGEPGRASDAGAGICSPQTWRDPDDGWWRFGEHAAAHLEELVARLADSGVDPGPEAFARCGSLVVALAEHEDQWFTAALRTIEARTPDIEEISTGEARAMFPPLRQVWRALHNRHAARVDGRRLTNALRTAGARRGVTVREGRASAVERSAERVTAVQVGPERISAGAVVLAAGAWSGGLAGAFGAPLPVVPLKGQIVHLVAEGRPDSDRWPIVQPILNFYLVPWPEGRVACGGTFEADAGFDARPTASGLRDLLRECVAIAPGLATAAFSEVRVGLRPASADDRPLLGRLPGRSNVYVCTGHGAEGLLLGAYSGALVASAVLGDEPPDLAPFDPGRFGTGTDPTAGPV
jgi:glycine/D-amino acid oxidase-like deaminating enzyme